MNLINSFKIFRNGIENWFTVALNMFVLKRDVICKIRNIGSVKLKSNVNYLESSLFRNILYQCTRKDLTSNQKSILKYYLNQLDEKIITIINVEDNKEFKFLNREFGLIFEVFFDGDYKDISYVDEGDLIDIGANVGDTAIYFANKGYKVYAFEPLPHIADIARKNFDLNPELKDKIVYVNKAVSCKSGKLIINYDENDSGYASEFITLNEQIEVETVTINDIIEEYGINPSVLKIDCEGCEVGIIKNSDLSCFSEVIFEYHTNKTGVDENKLINSLKNQGFKLKSSVNSKTEGVGVIHMIKM